MPWHWILLAICLVVGPFEALHQYIRLEKRRDELKRKRERDGKDGEAP